MSKIFEGIRDGLKEAISVARGDSTPRHLYIPAEIDVRAIRHKTGLTQENFASAFGFTTVQIRDWEQGRSRPVQAFRAYLLLIDSDPEAIVGMLAKARVKKAA